MLPLKLLLILSYQKDHLRMGTQIKLLLAGIIAILGTISTVAHNNTIDSLKQLTFASDTVNRARVFNELSYEYARISTDTSIRYAQLAVNSAEYSNDKSNLATGYYNLGLNHYLASDYEAAISEFIKSMKQWKAIENQEELAYIYKLIGISHTKMGKSQEALTYFELAHGKYLVLNNKSDIAKSYGNMGMACRSLSDYQHAIDYLIKAQEYFVESDDVRSQANTYNHIGNIFRDWDDGEKALESYEKALILADSAQHIGLKASILNNMGIIYRSYGNYEKAIELQTKSLYLKEKSGNKRGIGSSYLGLGITYKKMGDYEKALEYYEKTVDIKREVNDKTGEGAALGNIGLLYVTINQPEKAIENFLTSNEIAEGINYVELIKNNAKGISDAYNQLGRYKKALVYFKIHHELHDSIFNAAKHRQIEEIEVRFETEKKEKEIELLQAKTKLQQSKHDKQQKVQYGLIIILFILVFSAIIISAQLKQKNRAFKDLVKKNLELTSLQSSAKNSKELAHLSDDKVQVLLRELETYLKKEKPYLSPEFQLNDCAKTLETNSKYLSQTINEVFKVNFNNFINEFRIREARMLLSNEKGKHYTIEAIANDVGFNSKSTFNSAFKKFTGVTPSYYQANLNNFQFMD
jgi:tetratricopeptide (TPR) repeat protein